MLAIKLHTPANHTCVMLKKMICERLEMENCQKRKNENKDLYKRLLTDSCSSQFSFELYIGRVCVLWSLVLLPHFHFNFKLNFKKKKNMIKLIFSLILILYLFTFVSAQNSTNVSVVTGKALDDEEARRRKKHAFGHQIWCKFSQTAFEL